MALTKIDPHLLTSAAMPAVRGCDCKNNAGTPNTQFDLNAEYVLLRGSDASAVVRAAPGSITCNISTAGPAANGRDQAGAFSNSSWVHFYWIWNGSTLATVASATAPATGPTLPTGYTHWAYAGAVYADGSGNLKKVRIKGSRVYYETSEVSATISVAAQATESSAVSLSAIVPPNAQAFMLAVSSYLANASTTTWDYQIRVISGSDFQKWTIETAANQRGMVTGVVELPNVSQQYYWLAPITTGNTSTITGRHQVTSYRIPNGGE